MLRKKNKLFFSTFITVKKTGQNKTTKEGLFVRQNETVNLEREEKVAVIICNFTYTKKNFENK